MALRDAANNDPNANYDCKTILCLPEQADNVYMQGKYYDAILRPPLYNQDIRTQLSRVLYDSTKDKVVLLLDDAHILLEDKRGAASYHIRWWLRETRWHKQVVAVFAGTSFQLANSYSSSDPPSVWSRDPQAHYENWEERTRGPIKLYEPFFRICTMACFQNDAPTEDKDGISDFQRTAYFGHPLFAYLEKAKVLVREDDAKPTGDDGIEITNPTLHSILNRMLTNQTNWKNSTTAVYSILASRVQMGITTSMELSSALVSQGYAHLVEMQLDDESGDVKRAVARISFLPDPVCAALAMGLMEENWTLKKNDDGDNDKFTGETKHFWRNKAMELLESGVCYSEKGNNGEIMAALYMLFCGDVLRYDADKSLRTFSVPLTEWYKQMRDKRNMKDRKPKTRVIRSGKEIRMEVNFIQVCRNYFRAHNWSTQRALELMYKSASASYLHQDCKEMDVVASIRVMRNGTPLYHPLLVKVKYCMQSSTREVKEAMKEMKTLLKHIRDEKAATELEEKCKSDPFSECPPALCILVLLGVQQNEPRKRNQFDRDELDSLPEADTFRVVSVPTNDPFGISSAMGSLATGQEMSEIFVSHGFVYGEDYEDDDDETAGPSVLRGRSRSDKGTKFVRRLFTGFSK